MKPQRICRNVYRRHRPRTRTENLQEALFPARSYTVYDILWSPSVKWVPGGFPLRITLGGGDRREPVRPRHYRDTLTLWMSPAAVEQGQTDSVRMPSAVSFPSGVSHVTRTVSFPGSAVLSLMLGHLILGGSMSRR